MSVTEQKFELQTTDERPNGHVGGLHSDDFEDTNAAVDNDATQETVRNGNLGTEDALSEKEMNGMDLQCRQKGESCLGEPGRIVPTSSEAQVKCDDKSDESFGEFVAEFEETKQSESVVPSAAEHDDGGEESEVDAPVEDNSAGDINVTASDEASDQEDDSDGQVNSQNVNETSSVRSGSASGSVSEAGDDEDGSAANDAMNGDGVEVQREEDGESAVGQEAETGPSPEGSQDIPKSGTDFETYEQVAALIQGMNRSKIDWAAAQRLLITQRGRRDAILAAFEALLLHPIVFKDSRLDKNECQALRAWIRAQDLGLLDLVKDGHEWAQLLKGVFAHAEDKDNGVSRKLYELAAEQGNASAQNNLGILYYSTGNDYDKAREYFSAAAVQGHANAQCCLGTLFLEGKGDATPDVKRAISYFELAAKQGHAWAQYKLGLLYEEGAEDVKQDFQRARQYYELAVEQGFAMAQCNLASMYVKGAGVPVDYERARHLYELAVAQECAEAQCNLGHLYKNGMGVPQDYERAKEYYELAAKQGFAAGKSNLDSLSQEACVVS